MNDKNVSHLPTKITPRDRERQYPGILHENGGKLFCTACNIVVEHRRKSSIEKHFATAKHMRGMAEMHEGLQTTLRTPAQAAASWTLASVEKIKIEQETQDALTQPCIDEEKPQITGFAPNLDPGGSRCSPPENAVIAGTPWTMEKEDKLLELWRQNECLYKLTADKSHDRMEKEEKWTEIAAVLELPVEEVKVRATSLRNLYFKLVKAQQPGKKRKPMTMRQRSILTSCRFLTNQINHHSAESSLRDDEISDNEASLLPQHAKKQPRNQNDEDLETQKLALLQHMIDVLQETSREPQRDCEDVFGATVAMELKRIRSLTLRNRVKRQIMTVLYDALDSEPATDPSSYQNVEESNFVTVVIP